MTLLATPLSRRTLLAAGSAITAAASLPGAAFAQVPGTLLYDPAIPQTHDLISGRAGAIAIAGDRVRFWRDAVPRGPVAGFTSWSDFVLLSGLAAERGLRVRSMTDLSPSVRGTLIAWTAA